MSDTTKTRRPVKVEYLPDLRRWATGRPWPGAVAFWRQALGVRPWPSDIERAATRWTPVP